jgi:hypothetical protein
MERTMAIGEAWAVLNGSNVLVQDTRPSAKGPSKKSVSFS